MTFEPCPSGDCRGKLMVSSAREATGADQPAGDRAYCPLCRQSFERAVTETAWRPVGTPVA